MRASHSDTFPGNMTKYSDSQITSSLPAYDGLMASGTS